MSLSPWDLSGNISFDFSLYRPRRPSYVFATQITRRRNESYRHATKSESNSGDTGGLEHVENVDFIEGMVRKKRKDSYKQATQLDEIEMGQMHLDCGNHIDSISDTADKIIVTIQDSKCQITTGGVTRAVGSGDGGPGTGQAECVFTPPSAPAQGSDYISKSQWKYRKNLFVLSLSFILIFTAFRSIQNLQSSLNAAGHLGVIAMGCVHGTMFLTCLFAPVLINKLTSKWTIVLGLLFYLFWIAANFYPHFYTLIPTSIGVGFGQSLAWGAQVTYMQKLAVDYADVTKELTQQELYKFNGIFLALFQTSHIWGNLVSSLMLPYSTAHKYEPIDADNDGYLLLCGVYDQNGESAPPVVHPLGNNSKVNSMTSTDDTVIKLMGAYLVFAFVGFMLILLLLEKIGAKTDPEKPCLQMVWHNVQQLVKHKTYRMLVPLLIFNGFEQGFVYSDFNKSYITCTVGVEYVGYNMITLGMTNSLFSVLVGMAARHIPREAIIGVGSILHICLMVFLLVWIPSANLIGVFFVISALWGACDAIWQTQCNSLVNLSCPDDHDVAFQNFRMLQGLGASMAFMLGSFVCVSVKLYILISLLILSILFYVVVEYQFRRAEGNSDVDDLP